MRKLFCGAVLLFSVLLANTSLGYYGGMSRHGNVDFDTDWIWVGGEILPGRPKFKLSQHPDGYSMQIGMSGLYMRARYSHVDHSVDFSIADYKGRIKLGFMSGASNPTGEIELVGGRHSGWPLDAIVKVRFEQMKSGQYASPLDPFELVISLTNKGGGPSSVVEFYDGERIKDMKVFNTEIKAVFNPRNWAESTINFNLKTEGSLVTGRRAEQTTDRYGYRSYYSYDPYVYTEGTYNISASFMIINVVQPSSSERQPKITIALDMETNRNVPNGPNNLPNFPNKLSWKKSILFDGMINLTGKGARLGVMKVTDADTGNSIGRVQAKRADSENLRLEFFKAGTLESAINYYEGLNDGATNITFEDRKCEVGMTPFRIYERIIGDTFLEQRFYKDVFYIGEPCGFMKREIEGDKGMLWEEKMSAANDQYIYNALVSNGYTVNNFYVNLDNRGQDTKLQIGTVSKSLHMRQGSSQFRIRNSDRLELGIKPSTDEVGEFDLKVSFNNDRLFDGWFIGTKGIRQYARDEYPAAIQLSFTRYKEMHNQTISTLTEFV